MPELSWHDAIFKVLSEEATLGNLQLNRSMPPDQVDDEQGFLNAFGMFRRRDEVGWNRNGKTLLGA